MEYVGGVPRLSVVIIAKNEAARIGACLASVGFASERLVLDSGSTDATVAVAARAGARVVSTDWPGHVAQKNRGLLLARHPWVLSLDADERLSPQAAAEVQALLAGSPQANGYSFPRRNTWLGTPLLHGRWYPDRKIRLVRRERARVVGTNPHDTLVVQGPVHRLGGDILHTPYQSLAEHLGTIDRYTRVQAEHLHRAGLVARWPDVWLRPPLRFIDAYLWRLGVLDGRAGLATSLLGAYYTGLKWSRLRALNRLREGGQSAG